MENLPEPGQQLDAEHRTQVLDSDPWEFKRIVFSIDVNYAYPQQAALLHLVHPDTFEPIVSKGHKDRIVRAFGQPA